MPRTLRPRLRQMLERANPNVATFVEVSAPDQAQILRRAPDQFLTGTGAGGPLVSTTPAASAAASPAGALMLAATDTQIVNQYTDNGIYNIPQEDGGPTLLHTVGWKLDAGFGGCVLSSVTVLLHWTSILFTKRPNVRLQIYRARRTAGVLQRPSGSSTIETEQVQTSFVPLLPQPAVVHYADVAGTLVGGFGDITFDLTNYRLVIDPLSGPPPGPNETGDLPEIYFSITTDQQGAGNLVEWRYDTTSSRSIAGVGDVREATWTRSNPDDPASVWVETIGARTMTFRLKVRQFVATSQLVYAITLPALPATASTGRIVFERGLPAGTSATAELSTAGTGGPWTAAQNGDVVTPAQLTYHLRLTMGASADGFRSPLVKQLGVEFRNRVDLSAEAIVEHMSQDVGVPFLPPSIGEGRVTIVRTGRRDYRDPGSDLATAGPDTQIEADIYLASRHPQVTRDDWFQRDRAIVSSRQPSATNEVLSLLSLTKTLKRKIPALIESISSVHTVQATSPAPSSTQFRVSPNLQGASPTGNEYDARGYYLRVRKSAVPELPVGSTWTITGNTNVDKLDFTGSDELPAAFAAGDEVEVHSAVFQQDTITWIDQDPAAVWLELLTLYLGVSIDRIGLADIGTRGGYPPTVVDRAPGDATTQAKCKVTRKVTEQVTGDELIDQLSFIMGGVTVEIAGQIVFRQIYPLRDAAGRITVAPDPVAAIFDARDYTGLETPTGRENRITVLSCDYGVNEAGAGGMPASTASAIDVDALAAYETQDVEGLGFAKVPDDVARWVYNSSDFGRFLADHVAAQVVFAGSTGLRVWPWTAIDAHPELTVGDSVVVVTDQYTDYDPAQHRAIRGWNAYPLVLIGTSDGGRRFRGFLQGLSDVTAVGVRGGGGSLLFDPATAVTAEISLYDVRRTDTDTTSTFTFQRGSFVADVWAGYAIVTAPVVAADWDTVHAAMAPLAPGATSYGPIPRPEDKQILLVELAPYLTDGSAGPVRRFEIPATPQPPTWEYDDVETATTGTEYLQLTERGLPVALVEAQVQLAPGVYSAWGAPSRGPGDASVTDRNGRGAGTLGPLEYEQDTPLSTVKGRLTYVRYRWTLDNGDPPIYSPDFGFDAGSAPKILALSSAGNIVSGAGDSDVQSWKVESGAWSRSYDGQFLSADVGATDADGTAGQGANTTVSYTVTAYSVPAVSQGAATADQQVSQSLTVYNGTGSGGSGGSPAATWAEVYGDAPATVGSSDITIRARATATPVGWSVKVFINDPSTSSAVDETAGLSPTPSTVPGTLTSYVYSASEPRVAAGVHSMLRTVTVRVELRDGSSVVQDSETRSVTYDVSNAL